MEKATLKNQNILTFLLLCITVLLVARALPLLKAPFYSYGYDYGFYLFAYEHSEKLQLNTLAVALLGGFNNPLFFFGNLFALPASLVLNAIHFFSAILLGLAFFYLGRFFNWQTGVFACLLLAFSNIQNEAYLIFLWKNVVALPFLVFGLYFLLKKNYHIFAFFTVLILLTHRTTAIIFLLTSLLYLTWVFWQEKKLRLLGALYSVFFLLTALGFVFLNFKNIFLDLIYHNNFYVRTGLFLEGLNLFTFWWPFLLLAIPGLYFYFRNKENMLLPIFTLICAVWIVFHLPFYRRILIYLDLTVIFFSAYFLGQIYYKKLWVKALLFGLILFLGFFSFKFNLHRPIYILPNEVLEIKNFQTKNPGDFVLALSANDGPWLLGFAKNIRLGAPGLFEDRNTFEEWQSFWAGLNQKEFLSKYPRPLYIYHRSYQNPQLLQCLRTISQNFSEYICP